MTPHTISAVLVLVVAVLVLAGVGITWWVVLPARRANRPFRRAQAFSFVLVGIGVVLAIVNLLVAFGA